MTFIVIFAELLMSLLSVDGPSASNSRCNIGAPGLVPLAKEVFHFAMRMVSFQRTLSQKAGLEEATGSAMAPIPPPP